MGTRIGAALMIVVAAFLMIGIDVSGVLGMPGTAADETIAAPGGATAPRVVD